MNSIEISKASGVARGSICDYESRRCHPSFDRGEKIIALWCARTGRPRSEMPRLTTPTLSAAKGVCVEAGQEDQFASPESPDAARDLFAITLAWGARSAAP
ncbi:hypothetical protein [Variovorax paradoxus]|uniref:hypothetical protein n=1 Tax=Variovorax paradoxus TaxID=34073 RepID=UPI00118527EB|nr:hypothetical protein [Variovorax paradoxus]